MNAQQSEARLRGIVAAIRGFRGPASAIMEAVQQAAQQFHATEYARAARTAKAEMAKVEQALDVARRTAERTARRSADALARGLATTDFADPAWSFPDSLGTQSPDPVRVGTCHSAAGELPVLVPLLSSAGWYLEADTAAATDLVRAVVLRLLATAPANRLRVDCYDPRLTGTLGVFGEIRERAPGIIPPSFDSPAELSTCLAGLVDTVSRRAALLAQYGYASFDELFAKSSRALEEFRFVVLLNYPAGLDEAHHQELLRVVRSAAARGVAFLIHRDPAEPLGRDIDPAELRRHLRRIVQRERYWEIEGLEGARCEPDTPPDTGLFAAVGTMIGEAAAKAALPIITLSEVLPQRADWWQPATDELRVTIGLDNQNPAAIRLRSGNPPLPNMLVGGAVGQGKSNLLLVIIHGLAAGYAPADLQMYLLDFKQGLEFAALGPVAGSEHWLPHVKVLGVHSDREFGLAALRHVAAQLEVRSEEFKRRGVTDIAMLPPGQARPPRILLVLDEFQVLLTDDDAITEEAIVLLEKLVRLGRAYGIHVVLATQTTEGIQRLAIKRDAIFGQVPYRIVLKTTAGDSQSLLQNNNVAAAHLRFRGEAILNDNFGAVEANRNVLVAYADRKALDELRRDLWLRTPSPVAPRVFEQGKAADLAYVLGSAAGRPHDGTIKVWAGLPVSVDEEPASFDLRPEPGAGLLVLGDDATTALGALTGVAMSIAQTAHQRFLLLGMTPEIDLTPLTNALRCQGSEAEVVARTDVSQCLHELAEHVEQRDGTEPQLHVLGFGFHRAAKITVPREGHFDTPADALQTIIRNGPAAGVFVHGWWNRLSVCTSQLGFTRCDVNTYLFLKHPVDGVREVCGPLVSWSARPNRGLLWDGLADEPLSVVTFAPLVDKS